MRTSFIISACLLCSFLCNAQQQNVFMFSYFNNNGKDGLHLCYSNDGYSWTPLKNDHSFLQPVLSKDSLMRDPCIIRGKDNIFHMVWTVSWNAKGIGYASSPDLIHWSEQQYIPVMEHETTAINSWAPEITYDAEKKEYVIYWATTIPERFATGDTSRDSKYNNRMYYTTTKDFKIFSATKLLYDKGFNVIDATIIKNKKQYVMFLKDETAKPIAQKNIRIATSNKLTGGFSNPSLPVTGNYWAEGPTVVKAGKEWIVYFDKYRDHKYGAIASKNLKEWKDVSEKIAVPPGLRHGTIFTISQKEFAYILENQ